MSVPVAVLALVGGLAVLVRAADELVLGAETVAVRRRWSPAVIGAVVIGFGTSVPELLISSLAAAEGRADLAVGNAAGSNVVNLLLVLGVAALVAPVTGDVARAPRRDAAFAVLASLALLAVSFGDVVGAVEGAALITVLVAVLAWQVRSARDATAAEPVDAAAAERRFVVLRLVGGLVGVVVGAQLLVEGAVVLAERAGLSELFIGAVLVAAGTSLPELATSIAAARRGQVELLLGNLLGSNVFNALMVVGAAAVVGAATGQPLTIDAAAFVVVVAATVVTVGVALVVARRPALTRPSGAVLVALYLAAVPALLALDT